MKLTILLLTVGFLNVSAGAFSQKINYHGTNVSLEAVFYYIEKQTDYVFMFKEGVLNNTNLLTIKATEEPIEAFLDRLFHNQPFNYSIAGKSIFITRKPTLPIVPAFNVPEENNSANAELAVLILDELGKPLSGATIEVLSTKKMYMTNAAGVTALPAVINTVLKVSYIGYKTQEITISAQQAEAKSIVIVLQKSTEKLNDIQITAYGKTTKRLSTANIGTITGEEIRRVPAFTVFEALAGRVPGVSISPTMGNSAAPVKVEIRGRNTINPFAISDPLYVIDGIPFTTLNASPLNANLDYSTGSVQGGRININGENPLMSINPADIESVDILKDADATAIYGSRGANGVILITTKRGKSGPGSFNLSINNGFKSVVKYPELLKTEDYLAIRKEAFSNDNIVPDRYNAPDLMLWDQTKYTDWQRFLTLTP